MVGYLIGIILLSIAVVILLILILVRRQQDYSQSFALLQQRMGQVEDQVKRGLEDGNRSVSEKFENSLKVIGIITDIIMCRAW